MGGARPLDRRTCSCRLLVEVWFGTFCELSCPGAAIAQFAGPGLAAQRRGDPDEIRNLEGKMPRYGPRLTTGAVGPVGIGVEHPRYAFRQARVNRKNKVTWSV